MFELTDNFTQKRHHQSDWRGGWRGNAIKHMLSANIPGVEFIRANTDRQALEDDLADGAPTRVPISPKDWVRVRILKWVGRVHSKIAIAYTRY